MAVSELTSSRRSLLADIINDLTGTRPSVLAHTETELWASAANGMGATVSHLTHTIPQIIEAMDAALGGSKNRLTDSSDVIFADVVTLGGTSTDRLVVTQEAMIARLANLDLSSTPAADVDLDFTTGSMPSGVTFARASLGWYFNSSGVLTQAAIDEARFDYKPSDLSVRGLLVEGARTNGVVNPRGENGFAADATTIITNGDFSLNPINASQNVTTNGWRWSRAGAGSSTATWTSSSFVTLTPDGINNVRIDSSFTVKTLTTYAYSVTIGSNSTFIQIGTAQGGTNRVNLSAQGPGTITGTFTTTTETTEWIRISRTSAGAATVDDVIVTLRNRLPDNWSIVNNNGTTASLTYAGSGTDSGLPYVDMRYQGTSISGTALNLFMTGFQEIAASKDQFVAGSVFVKLVSGAPDSIVNFYVQVQERTTTGANNNSSSVAVTTIPTGSELRTQRISVAWTIVKADTVYAALLCGCQVTTGSTFDFTIRFACTQLELGGCISSPILATANSQGAVTRAAETAVKTITPVTECSIAVDAETWGTGGAGSRIAATVTDATEDSYLGYYLQGLTANFYVGSESNVSGNDDYSEILIGTLAAQTRFKAAAAQRQTKLAATFNGGSVSTVDQPVATAQDRITIGTDIGGNQLTGWVRRVRVWSRGLFDFQLPSASS